MPSFLARRCNGTRQTTVYPLSENHIPHAWRFAPTGVNANGEQTGSEHFVMRQGGVAGVGHTRAAALAMLDTVA